MDYELIYVIAIFLTVKIAALSPEFPFGEETENREQSPSRVEAPPPPPPPPNPQATSGRRNRGRVFDRGPGQRDLKAFHAQGAVRTKKIRGNQSFDTCEQKLELLQSSLNWRDIRKTLRWLDRVLASNQTKKELCRGKKHYRRFLTKSFPPSKTKLKNKHFYKTINSIDPELSWARRNSKTNSHSKRNKNSRKERKHNHRAWKTRLRGGKFKKEKLGKFPPDNTPVFNATFLKPSSVLFDVEKMFIQRTKSEDEHFQSHLHRNPAQSKVKKCDGSKNSEMRCSEIEEVRSGEANHENKGTKTPKQKPWPHFVYHRVSSNFLHPDSSNQNHKQSAYIAISVVTSSKPDSDDNNDI